MDYDTSSTGSRACSSLAPPTPPRSESSHSSAVSCSWGKSSSHTQSRRRLYYTECLDGYLVKSFAETIQLTQDNPNDPEHRVRLRDIVAALRDNAEPWNNKSLDRPGNTTLCDLACLVWAHLWWATRPSVQKLPALTETSAVRAICELREFMTTIAHESFDTKVYETLMNTNVHALVTYWAEHRDTTVPYNTYTAAMARFNTNIDVEDVAPDGRVDEDEQEMERKLEEELMLDPILKLPIHRCTVLSIFSAAYYAGLVHNKWISQHHCHSSPVLPSDHLLIVRCQQYLVKSASVPSTVTSDAVASRVVATLSMPFGTQFRARRRRRLGGWNRDQPMALLGGEVGGGVIGQCAAVMQKYPGDVFTEESTPVICRARFAWLMTAINRLWCRHVGDETGSFFCRTFVLLPEDVCVRGKTLYSQRDTDLRARHPLIIFYMGSWYVQAPLVCMGKPTKRGKHTHKLSHCSNLTQALWRWCATMIQPPYSGSLNNGQSIREFLSVILKAKFDT